MSAKRITVRAHNVEFLESLAIQMGISDITEVLNYLLLDCKGLGYSFGNKPAPQPQQPQAPIGYTTFEPATFEPAPERDRNERNHIEVDPVIARMSQLIEEF